MKINVYCSLFIDPIFLSCTPNDWLSLKVTPLWRRMMRQACWLCVMKEFYRLFPQWPQHASTCLFTHQSPNDKPPPQWKRTTMRICGVKIYASERPSVSSIHPHAAKYSSPYTTFMYCRQSYTDCLTIYSSCSTDTNLTCHHKIQIAS